MSEYPIPPELKALYERAHDLSMGFSGRDDVKVLIERIARLEQEKKDNELAFSHAQDVNGRLESENTRLRDALEHIANDGMDARQCMEMARAALAEKEPNENAK